MKLTKVSTRGKSRPKARKKAVRRKIFILAIWTCKSEKRWGCCVNDGRLRRSTARRVLRYFPQAPQSCKGRSSRTQWHFVPRDDAFALLWGLASPPRPHGSAVRFTPVLGKEIFAKYSPGSAKRTSGIAGPSGHFPVLAHSGAYPPPR